MAQRVSTVLMSAQSANGRSSSADLSGARMASINIKSDTVTNGADVLVETKAPDGTYTILHREVVTVNGSSGPIKIDVSPYDELNFKIENYQDGNHTGIVQAGD